jgi:membrane fusion protein (multidrug efflux system)
MKDSLDLPAITKAWQDLVLKTEVAGKVLSQVVKEGDFVEKGEIIAQIDPSDYQNMFDSIQARYKLAQANFARLDKLRDQSAASKSQFDEAQAALQELKANLADARLKILRCSVSAPISGIINSLPATAGTLLAYADPVAQIVDISKLKIDVAIPESDVSAIQNIQQCRVIFASLGNMERVAQRYFLAKQPSSAAMSYNLQLVLENDALDLLPGMFARAHVIKARYEKAIGIPLYAVLTEEDGQFVYVVEDNTALKRKVGTGFMEGWNIQVTSGLKENDLVVIVGQRNIEDGQKVQIVKMVKNAGEIVH